MAFLLFQTEEKPFPFKESNAEDEAEAQISEVKDDEDFTPYT